MKRYIWTVYELVNVVYIRFREQHVSCLNTKTLQFTGGETTLKSDVNNKLINISVPYKSK